MFKIKPFEYDAQENVIHIQKQRKPRAKQLNETLMSRPGGKMHNPKDVSRNKAKQQLRHMIEYDDE